MSTRETETLLDMMAERGLGWQEAADRAGIGRSSIWRWANGVSSPRTAQAAKLGRVLRVSAVRIIAASRRAAAKRARARATAAS